ncbi:oligosaccharide flippase family protein [Parahaliea maris]|uniref:oligosaccharide flippase family protein n=1 Tax=Parahaliea maris TaxID=2716870 RepID=UPI00164F2C64|nr:polysaccharide biosynthesis C-terminal domain-containing protein [Parahaliea maris]
MSTLVAIFLARIMGPENYGKYTFYISVILSLAIASQFGLHRLGVRVVAENVQRGEYSMINGYFLFALVIGVFLSLGTSSIFFIFDYSYSLIDRANLYGYLTVLFTVTAVVLTAILDAVIQGSRKVILGQVSVALIRPLVLISVAVFLAWPPNLVQLSSADAILAFLCAAFVSLCFSLTVTLTIILKNIFTNSSFIADTSRWVGACIPLAFTSVLAQINSVADVFSLSIFQTDEAVGIYRSAFQIANLIVIVQQALAIMAGPHIARLYAASSLLELENLVRFCTKIAAAAGLIVTLGTLLAGRSLVVLIFGDAYSDAALPLFILSIGFLGSSVFGVVGVVLNMTGNERKVAFAMTVSALANVVLNLALVPAFGVVGAAVATTVSLLLWNSLMWISVRTTLDIESVPLLGSRQLRLSE